MEGTVLTALYEVLQPHNILASMVGVFFGLFIGSTPGLTISLGMVLLLPLTFKLSAVTSICLMLGLYAAGMTGGSISAILLNIPGTPSASATAIDGYEMTKNGRAGEALGVAVVASFFGGIFGLTCLVLAAPLIARVALNFGAPELFAIVLLGYFMKKYGFPIVPMLLAIILGPKLEEHLRMSLIISQGDYSIFVTHPISLAFIIISVFSFITPLIKPLWQKKKVLP